MTPEQAITIGLYVFPARWGYSKARKCDTHLPLVKWGTEATNDPETVTKWREKFPDAYFCVACVKSNITIYDIDDKNGKSGSTTSATNELMYGEMPETWEVATPSGGKHLYYKGATRTGANRFGEGVDSPVMAPLPGSVVEGKGTYRTVKTIKGELPSLPVWCHEMAGAPKEQKEREEPESTTHLDNPLAIAQAATYLQTAPPAIEGEGGDGVAYKVCCAVRDFGISAEVAKGLMLQYYMARCVPGDPDWLREKVENAYQYAEKSLSESDVASGFEAVEGADSGEPSSKAPVFVDWGDLSVRPEPREWIVPGMIPKHEITAFYGEGGSGKSLLSLQLAMAINITSNMTDSMKDFIKCDVSEGIDSGNVLWISHIVGTAMTLYVSCEDDRDELTRRAYDVKESMSLDTKGFQDLRLWSRAGEQNLLVVKGRTKLEKGPFYKDLCDVLLGMGGGHKFVVLDTIADLFGGDENDRADVSQFIKQYLKGLCLKYDCTILLLGHTNKQGQASGSTGWINACRSQLQIARHENVNLTDYRRVWTGKANYAASGASTEQLVEWCDGVFQARSAGDIVDTQFEEDMDLMMEAIAEQAATGRPYGGHHTSSLYIHSGIIKRADGAVLPKDYTKQLLAELVKAGDVEVASGQKHGNGVWPVGG